VFQVNHVKVVMRGWRGLPDRAGGPEGSAKRGEDFQVHRWGPQGCGSARIPGL